MAKRERNLFNPSRIIYRGRHNDLAGDSTAGNTHHFQTETGELLYAKCGRQDFPYGAVNESVVAQLADELRLELPPHQMMEYAGDHYHCSLEAPYSTVRDFGADIVNCDVFRAGLARVLVFDTWVMNSDRHTNNILVRLENGLHNVVIIDHDRCLFSLGTSVRYLEVQDRRPPFELLHLEVRHVLIGQWGLRLSRDEMQGMVGAIQQMSPDAVAAPVRGLPEALLTDDERDALVTVLRSRQDRLGDLVESFASNGTVRSAFY